MSILARPVYNYAEIDQLLCLTPGTAKRWIDGYVRGGRVYEPVVGQEHTGSPWVTWGEFVETRLLSEFRSSGPTKRPADVPPEPQPRPLEQIRFSVDEDILGVGYALMWARPDAVTCGIEPDRVGPIGPLVAKRIRPKAGLLGYRVQRGEAPGR